MGSNSSQTANNPFNRLFSLSNWELVDKDTLSKMIVEKNGRIWRESHSSKILVECPIQFQQSNDYERYAAIGKWRQFQPNVVTSYHVREPSNGLCNVLISDVYHEAIKIRLSDLKDFPYPQNIYLTKVCLDGYHRLFNKFGAFEVMQEQICVNLQDRAKVWMNCDLTKHQIEASFRSAHTQSSMIARILQIIKSNTDSSTEPDRKLGDFFDEFQFQRSFQYAKKILNKYIKVHQVRVPVKLESVETLSSCLQEGSQCVQEGQISKTMVAKSLFKVGSDRETRQRRLSIQPPAPSLILSEFQASQNKHNGNQSTKSNKKHQNTYPSIGGPSIARFIFPDSQQVIRSQQIIADPYQHQPPHRAHVSHKQRNSHITTQQTNPSMTLRYSEPTNQVMCNDSLPTQEKKVLRRLHEYSTVNKNIKLDPSIMEDMQKYSDIFL